MLQFIVLGQIPGTNIYLSYTAISIGIVLIGVSVLVYMHRQDIKRLTQKRNRHSYIDQITL